MSFDFTTLKVGDIVKNKSGVEVKILSLEGTAEHPVVGGVLYSDGGVSHIATYTTNGRRRGDTIAGETCLVPLPPVFERWIVVSSDKTGYIGTLMYGSLHKAHIVAASSALDGREFTILHLKTEIDFSKDIQEVDIGENIVEVD